MFEVVLSMTILFYLIVDTLPDAFDSLANVSSESKGISLLKILPIIVVGGILYKFYKTTQQ